ncbi:MAG: YIP1 family protein [Candidatus Bathyarchaeia archaeon]
MVQNPKYYGPILIMILFATANTGSMYMLAGKTLVEATLPSPSHGQKDLWTENKFLWIPLYGAQCIENSTDYIAGNYYGNKSIEFRTVQSDRIAFKLQNIGPVNCSAQDGYTNLYFRVKRISPNIPPENVSLYLYSLNSSACLDISREFIHSAVNVWNNLTIHLASQDWAGNINWTNVTGLMLELTWSQKSNITILVDGLFFGGVFKPYIENLTAYMASYAAYSFMQFLLRWVLLGGLIHVLSRVFKARTVWRVTLVTAGFALITMFLQAVIGAAAFSTMPNLKYPFELMGGVEGEVENAYRKISEETWLVNQIYSIAQTVLMVWTVALCAIAVRLTAEVSWTTSILIAFVAYFAAVLVEGFLLQL